jgi:hypothetical protein
VHSSSIGLVADCRLDFGRRCCTAGWVAERFKAAVLKTANPQGFVGSNPTPSGPATIADHRQPSKSAGKAWLLATQPRRRASPTIARHRQPFVGNPVDIGGMIWCAGEDDGGTDRGAAGGRLPPLAGSGARAKLVLSLHGQRPRPGDGPRDVAASQPAYQDSRTNRRMRRAVC